MRCYEQPVITAITLLAALIPLTGVKMVGLGVRDVVAHRGGEGRHAPPPGVRSEY